ncbi:MAG TPA: hypothetical protein VGC65_05350 [Bacteroidia bacterium]|jgi:hypothetical protein
MERFVEYYIGSCLVLLVINLIWRMVLTIKMFDRYFNLAQSYVGLFIDVSMRLSWPTKIAEGEIEEYRTRYNWLVVSYYGIWMFLILFWVSLIVWTMITGK